MLSLLKINECTFDENAKRIDNLQLRNEKSIKKKHFLNRLPSSCYHIFSVKRHIEK